MLTTNHILKIAKGETNTTSASVWFWVSANYKAVHMDRSRRRHLWQQIVFLVQATSEAEARTKAHGIATDKEHEYEVASGGTVRWILQHIEKVEELFDSTIKDGSEVYWRFYERVESKTYSI